MRRSFHNLNILLLAGVTTLMSIDMTEAADVAELTVEQQTAKTIFENDFSDAREKLRELRANSQTMKWEWYEQWTIQPLKKSTAEALRVKVPPSTPIGFYDPIPFSRAVEEAAKMETEFRTAFGQKDDKKAVFRNTQPAANLKRYEAFRAQFTRGLSGDKLRIMDEEILLEGVVYAQDPPKFFIGYYGEGRKLLTKAEDFASARIWATADHAYASDDTLKRDPHWRVHIYHFDGMKLVHQTQQRGPGTSAPDRLFAFRAN